MRGIGEGLTSNDRGLQIRLLHCIVLLISIDMFSVTLRNNEDLTWFLAPSACARLIGGEPLDGQSPFQTCDSSIVPNSRPNPNPPLCPPPRHDPPGLHRRPLIARAQRRVLHRPVLVQQHEIRRGPRCRAERVCVPRA